MQVARWPAKKRVEARGERLLFGDGKVWFKELLGPQHSVLSTEVEGLHPNGKVQETRFKRRDMVLRVVPRFFAVLSIERSGRRF